MDVAPYLGTIADLEMRTARVADPALGTHFGVFHSVGQHPQHWFCRFDAQTRSCYRTARHDR
jgi:hypothetical protein